MRLGPLDIQFGGVRVKRGPFWLPDGLSVWWRHRGVHMFWSKSKYQPRVMFDRIPPEEL